MKNVVLFGSSGNIGRQSLEILKNEKDKFCLTAISIGKNESFLENDLKEFKTIKKVYSSNKLKNQNNFKIDFINENIENLIDNDTDIVINALSGFYGLKVTIESILKNKIILLANKESFVCAGELINSLLLKNKNSKIYPLDSEHCAIFQCLEKENKIEKILLTASGGPFLNLTVEETKNVNKDFALKHPKWNMGPKITIDSATMLNKCFEILEAFHLFNTKNIEVIIHPESIVHSMVQFNDKTIKAQMSIPDMKTVISYFLNLPFRKNYEFKEINFFENLSLNFKKIDNKRFKVIDLAYESLEFNSLAISLNASSEICVESFLNDEIDFYSITEIVCKVFKNTVRKKINNYDEIFNFDNFIREETKKLIKK